MTHPPEEPRIDRQIVDLVQEHWKARGTPLLLSLLGSRIRREDAAVIKNESENLAAYLRDRLADHVEVIQSSQNPTIIAAIPANVRKDSNTDVDAMLLGTLQLGTLRRLVPRFHPAFWAAFVKEPAPQTRRFVSVGPPPRFQELPGDTTPSDADATEVASEYIVGADDDVAAVHSSIKRWLVANSLDESLFLADGESRHKQLPSDDLLGRLIGAEVNRISSRSLVRRRSSFRLGLLKYGENPWIRRIERTKQSTCWFRMDGPRFNTPRYCSRSSQGKWVTAITRPVCCCPRRISSVQKQPGSETVYKRLPRDECPVSETSSRESFEKFQIRWNLSEKGNRVTL